MNNQSFTPYQRLELKNMSTEKIISIIRIAAKNYDDTSLILTPRIDQSGQAYYWTGLRFGGCTELEFKLCLNKEIEAFILCFLLKGKDGLVDVGMCSLRNPSDGQADIHINRYQQLPTDHSQHIGNVPDMSSRAEKIPLLPKLQLIDF